MQCIHTYTKHHKCTITSTRYLFTLIRRRSVKGSKYSMIQVLQLLNKKSRCLIQGCILQVSKSLPWIFILDSKPVLPVCFVVSLLLLLFAMALLRAREAFRKSVLEYILFVWSVGNECKGLVCGVVVIVHGES